MPRDDPKSMQEARWIDAESNTTKTRCHDARRDDAKRDGATMPVRDANVQRDDVTRRCRLNATMQSQGRYEMRQSPTRRKLDATMSDATMPNDVVDCQCSRHMHGLTMGPCMMRVDTDCQCMKTTTPIYNATMPRCQTRRCYATMPTRCHDAESRHENDDVDWLLHDDTNPC